MATKLAIRRNLKLISLFSFFIELRFLAVVSILFFAKVSGSYALGMSIFTITLFTSSFFEVPTGILSDRIGRKWTMVAGSFCDFLTAMFFGFGGVFNSYLLLVIGALIMGVADSLYSGTEDALLYETMSDLKKKHKYHEASGKIQSIMQVSAGLAALIGSFLAYKYSYTLVAFLSAVPMFICFIITLFYVEPKIHSEEKERNPFAHFREALRLFSKNKKLMALSVAKILRSTGDVSHRFQIAFFETLIPVWLIGIVRMLKQFGGAIGFWFAGKIINKFGNLKVLLLGALFSNIIYFTGLFLNSFISPFLFSTLNLFYGPTNTATTHLMQNEFSNKQRATMGSIVSFFSSILVGVVSIFVGWIADQTSTVMALYALMIPNIISTFLYWRALRDHK